MTDFNLLVSNMCCREPEGCARFRAGECWYFAATDRARGGSVTLPMPPEELTAGPTIEPAPERVATCTRSAPCQVRRDQDEVLAAHPGDVTCALLRREEDGWGLYVDGDLVTLIDYCPWCGGRLA